MADRQNVTDNLVAMYGRDDLIMRLNFRVFLHRSGLAALPREARVADLGCAMGHFIRLLRAEGFSGTVGVDAAPEMVAAAARLTGAEIALGEAENCDRFLPHRSFDAIVVSDLIHHIDSREGWRRLLSACGRVLRPGGLLVIREPWLTVPLRLLQWMARRPALHRGPLRARLRSFIEEKDLLDHFFAHWPREYLTLLDAGGFEVLRDFSWLVHRITTCRSRGGGEP